MEASAGAIGSRPGANPFASKRASSARSLLMMWTGTSYDASAPLTLASGWWSPTTIVTSVRGARDDR